MSWARIFSSRRIGLFLEEFLLGSVLDIPLISLALCGLISLTYGSASHGLVKRQVAQCPPPQTSAGSGSMDF